MPSALKDPSPLRSARLARQGRALRAARSAAGLSQRAAAALFGVATYTYGSWERGTRSPAPAVRARIAAAWGVAGPGVGWESAGRCPHCGRPY